MLHGLDCARLRRRSLPYLVALILAAACGGDSTGPLDNDQTDLLGTALRDEVETSAAGFFPTPALGPVQPCAGASPSVASSDDDIVPDSAVFVFTVPPCTYTGVRDGRLEVTGGVELVDPAPLSTGFDYRARLGNLAYRYVSPELEGTYTVIRNGTRTLSGTGTGLILDQDLQVRRVLANFVAEVSQDWHATFTPIEEGSLAVNQPVPDGSITIEGTLTWSGLGESYSLAVTTATPLGYDADCTDTLQRISSGELRAAGTFNGQDGYIRLVWTDCDDEPEIRFVAATE